MRVTTPVEPTTADGITVRATVTREGDYGRR